MRDLCDMCGSLIKESKCDCGTWIGSSESNKSHMKLAIEEFHEMKQMTLTGDMPHLGCAVIFFRGDYKDCKKIKEFILKLKERPFYETK